MGLRLDHGSDFLFTPQDPEPVTGGWVEASVSYAYSVTLISSPDAPNPPTPKTTEVWRIGIVQNVLYQYIRVVFGKRKPLEMVSNKQLLDAGTYDGRSMLPFYAPPVPFELKIDLGAGAARHHTIWLLASAEATYGPEGFHVKPPEGADPSDREFRDDTRVKLSFIDQPRLGTPSRLGRDWLMELDHLISLQFWIVAIGPRSPVILAASDPFTLVMWLQFPETDPAYRTDLNTTPNFASYSVSDVIKWLPPREGDRMRRFQEEHIKPVRLNPIKPSTRRPVLEGQLANQEGATWMDANGLGIKRPSPRPK